MYMQCGKHLQWSLVYSTELNCLKSEKVEHMTVINWIRVQSLKHHSADSSICFTKKYIREFRFLLCYLTVQKEEFRKLIISTRAATFWKEYAKQCIPVGCVPSAALAVSGSGWGVCLGGCVCPGGCTPPCEQNHRRCKNITFPQLRLRTVKRNPNKLLCIFHKKFNYMKQITNCCLYNFLEDVTSIPLKIYNYNK